MLFQKFPLRLTLLTIVLLVLVPHTIVAQTILRGTVVDARNGETLPSATVSVKEGPEAAVTDADGVFSLPVAAPLPVTLVVRYAGYQVQEVRVADSTPTTVRLRADAQGGGSLREVQVRGSRISEKQKESPLTVEALDIIGIRETPAANFYEGLAQLKGVDIFSASLAFKVLNTRGFSSTSPVRSLQLIDGVDNQSPGLNFSLGNFLGASELDLQRVELVVGASSAFYGPNAFNGVIAMTTRSPFSKPGLEVMVKGAERSLFEGAVRWAQVFKNRDGQEKFGYKANLFYLRANDWVADNLAPTPQSISGASNPGGYDAVNNYGDEFLTGSDYNAGGGSLTAPGLGTVYRTGYRERDLTEYGINNLKANGALHYRFTPRVEGIVASSFARGTTVYRGENPYLLKNVRFFQNRVELRQEGKWFIRAYATNENAGDSYDIYTTGIRLQDAAKTNDFWRTDYYTWWVNNYPITKAIGLPGFPQPPSTPEALAAWIEQINPYLEANYPDSLRAWHAAARTYADGVGAPQNQQQPRFAPGSPQFDSAFQSITTRSLREGGSLFIDRSALYHAQAEYRFKVDSVVDITVGGNFRLYAPDSRGTIFSDTAGRRIRNAEGGIYAGAEKRFFEDRLKANLSARLDKNQNFPFLFSPAASLVYEPVRDQFLRLSFSSAIRNPTLTDQYLYLFVGRALLAGNINGFDDLVTVNSLINSFNRGQAYEPLEFFDVAPVRPERVRTLEAGYRGTLFDRLYVDASAYYSLYRDFIGYKIGADIDTFTVSSPFGSFPNVRVNNILRVATNSLDPVNTMGATIGINYYIGKYLAFTGNYSYNRLDRNGSTDPLIPAFNTPLHKYNVGINGRNWRSFSFNVNYKWVQGYRFEGSPQFTGDIPSFGLLDAQVSRQFEKANTVVKLGASNLLNNLHYEVYGGPLIGRLIYASVTYSLAR